MAKSTTNWDSVETWERLVASIIASGIKIDLAKVAHMYGTTYHTLENRLRKTKKLAKELEGGEASPAPKATSTSIPRKGKNEKKDPLETVTSGRVTKKTSTKTPTIKQEDLNNGANAIFRYQDNIANNNIGAGLLEVGDDMFTGMFSAGTEEVDL